MRFLVTNSKGSTGKTTLTREVFSKHMQNPLIIELEGVNSSSINFKGLNIIKYDSVNSEMIDTIMNDEQNIVIDAGASRIESLIMSLERENELLQDEFEAIIIPAELSKAVLDDTIETIKALNDIEAVADVPKIVVFNKVMDEQLDSIDNAVKRVKRAGAIAEVDLRIDHNSSVEYLSKASLLSTEFDNTEIKDLKAQRKALKKEGKDKEALELVETMQMVLAIRAFSKETEYVFKRILEIVEA